MEALMREDDGFRRHVESAELRLTKRLADVLERRDRESQDRKRLRQGADQRGGGDGDLEGHQPEVAERTQSGGNPGDVVMGDDMGIPLATGRRDMHTNTTWNFLEKKDQDKLITLLARRPTQLLIASPPYNLFSPPQMMG